MKKEHIKIGQELYYNTTGASNSKISLLCKVIDIGEIYVWVLIYGNIAFNNILANDLTLEPLNKVTNERLRPETI